MGTDLHARAVCIFCRFYLSQAEGLTQVAALEIRQSSEGAKRWLVVLSISSIADMFSAVGSATVCGP